MYFVCSTTCTGYEYLWESLFFSPLLLQKIYGSQEKTTNIGLFWDFVVCSIILFSPVTFLVSLTLFEHLTILRMLSFGYAFTKLFKVV